MIEFPTPFKTNSLFGPGPNPDLNACVGVNGGPYDAWAYAQGYFRAGKALVNDQRHNAGLVDLAVYPIAYLYRHAVELAVKHLVTALPVLWDEAAAVKLTHELGTNWELAKSFLSRDINFDPDSSLVPAIDRIVKDLSDFDPRGEVFRFPESRTGDTHLLEARIINLAVLGEQMDLVGEVFHHWVRMIDAIYEAILDHR